MIAKDPESFSLKIAHLLYIQEIYRFPPHPLIFAQGGGKLRRGGVPREPMAASPMQPSLGARGGYRRCDPPDEGVWHALMLRRGVL